MDIIKTLKEQYREMLIRYDNLLALGEAGANDEWVTAYVAEEKRINFAKEEVIDNILISLNIDPTDFHCEVRRELRNEKTN